MAWWKKNRRANREEADSAFILDDRPHKTHGHAWYCDCGECMLDGNVSQWKRRGLI